MVKQKVEIITLLILFLLAIILYQDNPMFSNVFILIAGLFTFTSGLTLPTIQEISGTTITYITIDPWISYAIGLIFITLSVINWLDLIDNRRSEANERKQKDYARN
jgi:predicted membrane protein